MECFVLSILSKKVNLSCNSAKIARHVTRRKNVRVRIFSTLFFEEKKERKRTGEKNEKTKVKSKQYSILILLLVVLLPRYTTKLLDFIIEAQSPENQVLE